MGNKAPTKVSLARIDPVMRLDDDYMRTVWRVTVEHWGEIMSAQLDLDTHVEAAEWVSLIAATDPPVHELVACGFVRCYMSSHGGLGYADGVMYRGHYGTPKQSGISA